MRQVTVTLTANVPGWDEDPPEALQQHVGGLLNDARCNMLERVMTASVALGPGDTPPQPGDPLYFAWCVFRAYRQDADLWGLLMENLQVKVDDGQG